MLTFQDLLEGKTAPPPRKQPRPRPLFKAESPLTAIEAKLNLDSHEVGHNDAIHGNKPPGAGWLRTPKGWKKRIAPGADGKNFTYMYPDGKGGFTEKESSQEDKNKPKIKPKPKSLFTRIMDRLKDIFSKKETTWADELKEVYEQEKEEQGISDDIPLSPEVYKQMETRERLLMMAEDGYVQASIANNNNINSLLALRKTLLEHGAKEPSSRTKRIDDEEKKKPKKIDPSLENKPKVRKKIDDETKKAQRALNKLLALVNKRLTQLDDGIIGKVSGERVKEFLVALKRDEQAEEEDKRRALETLALKRRGFIVSLDEIEDLMKPIRLIEKEGGNLRFEDDTGITFRVRVSELRGPRLNAILDMVEEDSRLAGLRKEPKAKKEKKKEEVPQGVKDIGIDEIPVLNDSEEASQANRDPDKPFDFKAPEEKEEAVAPPPGSEPVIPPAPIAPEPKPKKKKKAPGSLETKPADLEETAKELSAPLPKTTASSIDPEAMRQGSVNNLYITGKSGSVEATPAQWAVVEADSIITSHTPDTFRIDERHNVGNERAYHRDKAEQAKVMSQANNLKPDLVVNTNPDATNGAPIVDENGVVLGGNSRSMSMKRVYSSNESKAEELRNYIKTNASQFGLTSDDVSSLKNPILVRQVAPKDDAEKQLLVRQLNENLTQAMDPRTMAVAQARRFDEKAVRVLAKDMEADETLNSFLNSTRGSDFIDELRSSGIISNSNQNAYINQTGKLKGKLNENGKSLVENIIVGKMIPDADLLTQLSQKTMKTIARSAPYMLQAEGSGDKYSVKEELSQALSAVVEIQASDDGLHPTDMEKRRKALEKWERSVQPRDMKKDDEGKVELDESLQHPAKINPKTKALLRMLIEKPGPVQLSKVFKKYAEAAEAQRYNETAVAAEMDLGYARKDHNDVFNEVFDPKPEKTEEAEEKKFEVPPEQGGLF